MKLDRTLIDKDGAPSVKETQEYFKKNDYTTAPNPFDVDSATQKELSVYMKSREIFKKTWLKKQKKFGGKDSFLNFSENYPLAVLEKADEELISGTVTNIVSNSELYEQTIDSFFTNLQPQIELAFETYAKQFNKDLETITDEEIAFVIDKFVDLFLDHMMESLMKSQGVPKIIKTARQLATHEDFNNFISENSSRADFYRKWDHTRTKIGKIFTFSEITEDSEAQAEFEENLTEAHTLGYSENEIAESETLFMKFENVYFSMLDQEEIQIYKSRMRGCTTQMIAKDLGYKTHSAIVKKLKKMRKKFDEMCKAINKTK
jgi:hypothetical protein